MFSVLQWGTVWSSLICMLLIYLFQSSTLFTSYLFSLVFNTSQSSINYKSQSIAIQGDELSTILRLFASIELYTNVDFYVKYFSQLWVNAGTPCTELALYCYIISHSSSHQILSNNYIRTAFRDESVKNASALS